MAAGKKYRWTWVEIKLDGFLFELKFYRERQQLGEEAEKDSE